MHNNLAATALITTCFVGLDKETASSLHNNLEAAALITTLLCWSGQGDGLQSA